LKTKNYREKENLKERGTKRFQERKAEEKEAEEEIKHYDEEPLDDKQQQIQE
jgi:hypothetical protein